MDLDTLALKLPEPNSTADQKPNPEPHVFSMKKFMSSRKGREKTCP
jgi:hypothetical protein